MPDLVRGLADADWRKREKFAAELARVGEPARPALDELVRTTTNPDVRTAAQNVLREIDDNKLVGPSFITLHLKDAPQQQAFAELGKQAFTTLKPYPDNLWGEGTGATVSIDVDRQPFWVVMRRDDGQDRDRAARAGRHRRRQAHRHRWLRRRQRRPSLRDLRQFQVVVNQLTLNRTVTPGGKGARTDETFNIQLTAYAEPKLTVLKAGNGVKLEEVVDDKGNSLIPGATTPRPSPAGACTTAATAAAAPGP